MNNSNKLITISNPLTIEDSNSYNKDLNKSKSLLYVGRLEYNQKKVIRILHLWKELENKYPDWNLIIVGDGPEKESLIKYTESNNLQRVEFKGFKNPIEYYRKCPIILMTSDYEGLPLTLIEAISFGTIPIVYESFTSIHDIIKNGENGIIIPKSAIGFNKQLMIEEISRLIENDQLKKRLSYNAYISSRKYDINHIYNQWNILFNSYLS